MVRLSSSVCLVISVVRSSNNDYCENGNERYSKQSVQLLARVSKRSLSTAAMISGFFFSNSSDGSSSGSWPSVHHTLRVIPPSTKTRKQTAVQFVCQDHLTALSIATTLLRRVYTTSYMIACERGRCTCCPKPSGEMMVVRHLLLSIPLRKRLSTAATISGFFVF